MNMERNTPERGHLFIISAPSGTGKTTLLKAVRKRFPDMLYSISSTTRAPRNGEQDGVDYHFISRAAFKKNIEKEYWAEWAEVHGNYYGTSAQFIEKSLASGRDVFLDIDVQGTVQILKHFPDSVTIFVLPPSMNILRKRLAERGTESKTVMEKRLAEAQKEMTHKNRYAHIIVNDELPQAIEKLTAIIQGYRPG